MQNITAKEDNSTESMIKADKKNTSIESSENNFFSKPCYNFWRYKLYYNTLTDRFVE